MSTAVKNNKTCICGNTKSPSALVCKDCAKDLYYYLAYRDKHERSFSKAEFIKKIRENRINLGPGGTCALCGGKYVFIGNNPWPVLPNREDNRCCHRCDEEIVTPIRFEGLSRGISAESLSAVLHPLGRLMSA